MRVLFIFFTLVFYLLCLIPAYGKILNVPDEYSTIQWAIQNAQAGDTVLTAPGTYVENLNYYGNNIVVGSLYITTRDTSYISRTIIDGGQNNSVVQFTQNENNNAFLIGFTIQNGKSEKGGGIYCASSNPTISYCLIKDNVTANNSDGGGIYCENSNPNISHCTITNNKASGYGSGGGIYCYDNSNPNISNCYINKNKARDSGAGIYCGKDSSPLIRDCIITENYATWGDNSYISGGGGIGIGGSTYTNNCNPVIQNCTIVDNRSLVGGGIGIYGDCSPIIENCTINNNLATRDYWGGGGVCIRSADEGADITFSHCIINENMAYENGGGMFIHLWKDAQVKVYDCIISKNVANNCGGGIGCENFYENTITIVNTTIVHNNSRSNGGGIFLETDDLQAIILNSIVAFNNGSGGIAFGNLPNTSYTLMNCDIYHNSGGNLTGNIPQNLGLINNENVNGDVCDIFNNIYFDPMFVDTANGNYRLSSNSPCIDSGILDTTGLNLSQIDLNGKKRIWDGNGEGSAIIDVGCYEYGAPDYISVDSKLTEIQPDNFQLYQNYPNPFNPSTTITYTLAGTSEVKLIIYNLLGQKVRILINNIQTAGQKSISWDGKDEKGSPVPSGLYIYILQAANELANRKMLLLR